MRKCAFFKKVSSYIDNQLYDAKKVEFAKHLAECEICSREVSRLKRLSEQMRTWQAPEVSQGFEGAVKNKIVAWELERGDEKMKKTISILIPSGVIVGILVFLVIGKTYLRQGVVVGAKPQQQTIAPATATSAQPVVPTPAKPPAMPTGQKLLTLPPPAIPKNLGPVPYNQGKMMALDKMVMLNNAVTKKIAFGRFSGYSRPYYNYIMYGAPGVQYPPQSEFFEEEYARIYENDFHLANQDPLSTFSIDVDTASYTNAHRFLVNNQLPPEDAVRVEEMINYFTYDYPQPTGSDPFSVTMEVSACPWNTSHKLALIGLQGKKIETQNLPPSNLVFLIDSSGSMKDYNKLPLLKQAFLLLVNQLRPQDKISIVTYSDYSRLVLDSATGDEKDKILQAIYELCANGSTNGAAGVVQAYEIAKKNYIKDANNRVILATDGDFNVGITSDSELIRLIEERRNDGIFLTILGFGMGNYKDAKMEQLADKGNGSIAYINNLLEAKKVFVTQLTGTLLTIAKDVKIQVEFNPGKVKAYRLIGYENRKLENKDFNDDKKDAGEIGAGHSVTALYEIVSADSKEEFAKTDNLKYQQVTVKSSDELMTVKLRYKEPNEDTSKLLTKTLKATQEVTNPSENFKFAASVAEFGMLLRNSPYKAHASYQAVIDRAKASKGEDPNGDRSDFIRLAEITQMIDTRTK